MTPAFIHFDAVLFNQLISLISFYYMTYCEHHTRPTIISDFHLVNYTNNIVNCVDILRRI